MTTGGFWEFSSLTGAGEEMHRLIQQLYPICRSITGPGVRETLRILQGQIPLSIREVPSGTRVFDWTVPPEWEVRDAYIRDPSGRKIADFQKSNLHLVSYSEPVDTKMSLAELREHLFTLPDHPDWIPYRTAYYKQTWGFCLTHNEFLNLEEGEYEVRVDATLKPGHLTYGELYLEGTSADEMLISAHVCHPSLCNDNLSGIAVSAFLAKILHQLPRRYSYRFLFLPGTIGSIAWLCLNEARAQRIRHGLVAACVGDPGPFTYKKSRRGDAEIDKAVMHVLKHSGAQYEVRNFFPFGYDERQYCSPGFNLPVGSLSRTPHGCYPEYHTSADNLNFVRPESLEESLRQYLAVVGVLEHNRKYVNLSPKCEPQLGRRGLYSAIGGAADGREQELAMLWVLNLSDGEHSLLEIADAADMDFRSIQQAADLLKTHGLLKECPA
jgi:aminopeptidase-like protein